jgi:hypothetical protein
MEQIGYGLTCTRSETINKKKVRVYQIVAPDDGRAEVFEQWSITDKKSPGSSELWLEDRQSLIDLSSHKSGTETSKYIQLSWDF